MPATRLRHSFLITDILHFFRDRVGESRSYTVEEVLHGLQEQDFDPSRHSDAYYYWRRRLLLERIHSYPRYLARFLGVLAELDLVVPDDSSEDSSGIQTWRIGDSWRPREPPRGGGRGDGPIGPSGDDGGSNDDDGGGGLREALGHPVLFALPEDAFDELVSDLFSEIQS